jgi:glycosyltransferase involved in cell wall biosynthesis
MKGNSAPYHLVHIVSSGEYKSPLVASQVFDRAQEQAITEGADKPASVSVWIIAPMRDVFDAGSKELLTRLRMRCPNVRIVIAGGISRLGNWPILPLLKSQRSAMKGHVVYHCRGESSLVWAVKMRNWRKSDAAILDVRGFWPLERNADTGVFDEKDMSPAQLAQYRKDVGLLKASVATADGVCTVSEPLRQFIIETVGAPAGTVVIPCCVKDIIDTGNRDAIRTELGIGNRLALIYLGGTQRYQHLEDMVMPFVKSALMQTDDTIAFFVTQNKDKMAALLQQNGLEGDRVRLMSLKQEEVGKYLTAMDMGLLLRESTIINNHAQPVKFGEYLSAGLPVIMEAGTWNTRETLERYGLGCAVQMHGKQGAALNAEVQQALYWARTHRQQATKLTLQYVQQQYTWRANAPRERALYKAVLQQRVAAV